ncbi:hypothetical protein [Zooshikella ganghwensis]|uniref:Secreted protein n=1 Tax=Zooshikella ganghwensis TaxID=202772 RepID=A0A4P9VH91_9GAMM|nr:hypothetical protein [Zooshikella ganghwensis]RDH41836.1 hypothetical protein B9G39_26805 [Zooshikella ganghwensis]RDH41867.1 hypothetical protein B9G39_25945 [Zooshikella ganghwensis]
MRYDVMRSISVSITILIAAIFSNTAVSQDNCGNIIYQYYQDKAKITELLTKGKCHQARRLTVELIENPQQYKVPESCKTRKRTTVEINEAHEKELEQLLKMIDKGVGKKCS